MLQSIAIDKVELHQVHVLPDGSIAARENPDYIHFSFQYLGLSFIGTLDTHHADNPTLELRGTAGLLPFSIQGRKERADIAQIIQHSKRLAPIRLGYRMDNRIEVIAQNPVQKPITSTHLLASAVEIIVHIEPYLQLLAKYLIAAPHKPTNL
jgi:hypothetical protein